jgi:hypothetical protein
VLVAGTAAFGAGYLVLALTGATLPILAVGFVLAGIGIGCVETAEHAAVAHLAPERLRGSAFGTLATVQSLGNLVASDRRHPLDRRLTHRRLHLRRRLDAHRAARVHGHPHRASLTTTRRITTSVTAVTHAAPGAQATDRASEPENDALDDELLFRVVQGGRVAPVLLARERHERVGELWRRVCTLWLAALPLASRIARSLGR